jgi:hypothetical protein
MSVFRIGIFLAYVPSDMPLWEELRDYLRKNGFVSAFLVKDYPSDYFENNRKKSFFFVNDCHTPFFVIEKQVGSGGVVCELEEYKREVYPKKGKVAVAFEQCSFVQDRMVDTPSTLIAPNLTEEKFHVRRYIDRTELLSMVLGAANQMIYEIGRHPYNILDIPEYRLTCQNCSKEQSKYLCLDRCSDDCNIYHLCKSCANSKQVRDCTQNGESLYEL